MSPKKWTSNASRNPVGVGMTAGSTGMNGAGSMPESADTSTCISKAVRANGSAGAFHAARTTPTRPDAPSPPESMPVSAMGESAPVAVFLALSSRRF